MEEEFAPDDNDRLEALAAEQRKHEALRDEADASLAAAQDILRQAGQQAATNSSALVDPHGAEREALGFDLAWWSDEGENNTPPLDTVVDLTNQACGRTHFMTAVEELGLDLTPTTAYVGLNAKTGPLVFAGLQILGTLHSHIRDEVTKVLKQIFDATPEFSEEFEREFERISSAYEEQQLRAFAERMGVEVLTTDEYAEKIVADDEQRRDASNN